MFSKTVSLFALFVGALAAPARREESLQATVSAARQSTNSNDLVVSATVTNPTDEDIRVIKYNTLLDELPTRSFQLFKDDKEVDFKGYRITPDLTDDSIYVTIPAGQSVTVEHNLGSSYSFGDAGTGEYTVQPIGHFQYGPQATEVVNLAVESVTVQITDIDSPDVTVDQTTPQCSDSGRLNQLRSALAEARALAGGAASDVRNHPNSAAYARYFGNNNRDDIWWNLDRIAGDLPSSGTRILSCTDPNNVCSRGGIVAYTLLVTSGGNIVGSDIFACDPFWGSPATSTICSGQGLGVRGSIILHELSHAVFGASDVYGCDASAGLNDAGKKNNADNYACFGVQTYRDYNC